MKATINGVTTQYLYDGMNPVEELDGASPANVTATMLTGLGIDQYFARTGSNGTVSYLTNRLGSTIALANSSGAITTQYSYEPFGNTTVSGSSTNPFQFTGRENDGTGLYYYRARYYSPTLGRFISQDPLGFAGGNAVTYAYVWQDPENLVDPLGLFCNPTTAMAIGSAAGLIVASVAAETLFPEVVLAPGMFQLAAMLGSFAARQGYMYFNSDCNPTRNPKPKAPKSPSKSAPCQ